jgi:adenosylcobinamide-GDP ribazoletransferase
MGGITTDIRTGLAFCTRLPLRFGESPAEASLAQAVWTFPVIGVFIGALGALVYWLGYWAGLSSFVAATLVLAASVLVTGCLHEDGLADTADGFGGGGPKERKLEMMRDSRSGSYGVVALLLAVLLRVGAIASLIDPGLVAAALIAAHAGARAAMPVFMAAVPCARHDGLSAKVGTPPSGSVLGGVLLGLAVLVTCLGFSTALVATIMVAGGLWLMARLSLKQIGGQTGDVIGAVEQVSEILILLAAAALL